MSALGFVFAAVVLGVGVGVVLVLRYREKVDTTLVDGRSWLAKVRAVFKRGA